MEISVGSIAGSGLFGLIGLFVGIEWWCYKKESHDLWTKFKGAALGIGVAHLLLAFTVFREYWSFMPWLTGIVYASALVLATLLGIDAARKWFPNGRTSRVVLGAAAGLVASFVVGWLLVGMELYPFDRVSSISAWSSAAIVGAWLGLREILRAPLGIAEAP